MVSIGSSRVHVSVESTEGISTPVFQLPLGMRPTSSTARLLLERCHDRELLELLKSPMEVFAYHPRLCEAVQLFVDTFDYMDVVEHPNEPLVWT